MNWEEQLLQLLGIPNTAVNTAWLDQWATAEGSGFDASNGYNPFNIRNQPGGGFYGWTSPQQGLAGTAAWLQSNGNFGGIGTYAQNIANYLTGQTSSIGQSLAYFSGQGGNPNGLTSSYKNLIGGVNYDENAGPGQNYLNWLKTPAANTPEAKANENATVQGSIFDPIVSGIENAGALALAALLIAVGGLWLVLSNKNTQTVIKEGAKAAIAG